MVPSTNWNGKNPCGWLLAGSLNKGVQLEPRASPMGEVAMTESLVKAHDTKADPRLASMLALVSTTGKGETIVVVRFVEVWSMVVRPGAEGTISMMAKVVGWETAMATLGDRLISRVRCAAVYRRLVMILVEDVGSRTSPSARGILMSSRLPTHSMPSSCGS